MGLFRRKKKQQARNTLSAQPQAPKEQKVFSYYTSSHKQLTNTQRVDRLKFTSAPRNQYLIFARQHWFGLIAAIVLVVSSVYIITLSMTPQVTVNGTVYRTTTEYNQLAQSALKSNVLNVLKPTLQRAAIEKKLKEQIPEAKTVQVSAPLLGRRANVVITMDEPAAVMKQSNTQDLIVSERGRLLLAATQSKGTTDLPVIINNTGVTGKAGEQFLRPDDMRSLLQLMQQVKLSGSSASFILPPQTREIIMLEPSRGVYQVRFLFGDTMLQQFGAMRATQKKLQELGQTPVEYMDVRLGNKVFYK